MVKKTARIILTCRMCGKKSKKEVCGACEKKGRNIIAPNYTQSNGGR